MEHDQALPDLRQQRSQHKLKGDLRAAIPVQLLIIQLQTSPRTDADLANDWNYLSMLYRETGQHIASQDACIRALEAYATEPNPRHETLGCYQFALALSLCGQSRFAEAVPIAESALEHYSVFHNPPDDFITSLHAEVALMRNHRDAQLFE
jgi:hypothetical protein